MERNQQNEECDDSQQVGKIDFYEFSRTASLGLVDQLRPGLPPDARYVAGVSGYGTVFAIREVDKLIDLVDVIPIELVPSEQQSQAADPERARAIGPYYLKTSMYHEYGRFIRYDLEPGAKASLAIQAVRGFLCERQGHQEAQLVVGEFRMLVYMGSNESSDDLDTLQEDLEQAVPVLRYQATLEVIDYVSRSQKAPPGHQP